jgi:ankyrin repeat protein
LVLLIEHLGKSVVDLHDANKRTPLHIAAMSNSVECCKILIENGCDVNSRDDKMRTPLMLACQFQNLKCIELLLSTGCDLDLVDKIGNMALHYGCEKDGHAANVILDSASFVDTNVSRQNNKGKTPLHIAASNHLVDTCEKLLLKGSAVNIIDNEGANPIVSVATSDEAATCLTMILEVFKMEIQSGSGNSAENIRRAKRSISSIGSFRTSDNSSSSSRFSDDSFSVTAAPSDFTFTRNSSDRQIEPNHSSGKKRSLPILLEDVHQSISAKNEAQ